MASSRDTSNGPDWKDVARAMLEFEGGEENILTVKIAASGTQNAPKLLLLAAKTGPAGAPLVPQLLGSASVHMPGSGAGDLCAALLSLLYELDKDEYRRTEGLQPRAR